MKPPGDGADLLRKPRFGLHVNVFEGEIVGHAVPRIILGDLIEAGGDRRGVFMGEDALRRQHRDMGPGSGDVLPPHDLVERDRGVYLAHYCGRAFGEAPAPHRIGALIAPVDRLSPARAARDRGLR